MRNAYALLGISFIIVFSGAFVLLSDRAHAPASDTLEAELVDNQSETMSLSLTASAFDDNGSIPSLYTCDGDNIFPPLAISGVPEDAKSLVLVMDDPDIPAEIKEARGIEKFNHFVSYNIPADTTEIDAESIVGTMGTNSAGEGTYRGPCPPREYAPTEHRYIFRLYALSDVLTFENIPTLDEVESVAKEKAIAQTELIGLYERSPEE
ncbi:MAG: Raf kinase inhibitor-like YbhB/YbcL family protein [Candidatus Azotimanducaceae bacterium]|jgi:Raf kinase inhibitor-like YbhB/YbcL family protein